MKKPIERLSGILGLALVFGMQPDLVAQEPPTWGVPSPEECSRADRTLSIASGHERYSAIRYLATSCGESGGDAMARAFLGMRVVSDTIALNQIVRGLVSRRSPTILSAATDVVSDPSATLQARVAGLRVIVTQAHPRYRAFFRDFDLPDEGMLVAIDHVQLVRPVGPEAPGFPAGWKERTEDLLEQIMKDPGESEEMQFAANRGLYFLRTLGPR